ncbi:putative uncharacterized protein [Microcella alkaliphila]|jgi:hypothetical protein|uniref:Uncharacterized protein n=2 Tax=Microcella alkaliphila TaxID=279828 RepID=A0A0U5BCE5_9MICO|nr:putative uncharacterized protein [Microcella alkaliphila]
MSGRDYQCMDKKSWIAAGAASALGLGALASGALTVANAMPLYDASTATDVPPITTVASEAKAFTGTGDVRFWVQQSTVTPTPTAVTPSPATPSPASSAAPAPAPTVQQAPAPAPQPVAPAPAGSVDSPDSPDSPD